MLSWRMVSIHFVKYFMITVKFNDYALSRRDACNTHLTKLMTDLLLGTIFLPRVLNFELPRFKHTEGVHGWRNSLKCTTATPENWSEFSLFHFYLWLVCIECDVIWGVQLCRFPSIFSFWKIFYISGKCISIRLSPTLGSKC